MFLRVRVCSERQTQLSDDATQRRAVLFARTGETIHLSWRARTDLRLSSSLISAHAAKPFICLGAWLGGFVQSPWWVRTSGLVQAPRRARMGLRLSSSLLSANAAKPFICLGAWLGGFVQSPWWVRTSEIVHAPWRARTGLRLSSSLISAHACASSSCVSATSTPSRMLCRRYSRLR